MRQKGEINLAPYSFFNGITDKPPIVMFSSEGAKDSVAFAEETKEFVCNLAVFELREQMNQTSAPLERGRRTAAALANSELRIYEGAPHGLFMTHRERLNADLLDFIAE